MTGVDRYTELLVFASLPAANGFPLVYGLLQPWWRSQVGRALLTKATGLAIILNLTAAVYIFGDYWIRPYVRAAAFTLVVVGIWYQFLVFAPTIWRGHRARVRDRHARRAGRV